MISGYKHEQVWVQLGGDEIWESVDVKLLGVTFDRELKFDKHDSKIWAKASRKLLVLATMSNFLLFEKRKTIFKASVESQFKYPLIWMFHNWYINNKINRLHERALWIVNNDYEPSLEQLLIKDNSFCVHDRNI